MRRALFAVVMSAALLLGYATAQASHEGAASPCCKARTTDLKACNETDGPEDLPGPSPGAGCVESPDGSTCAGGDATVPAGCICVGGACVSGSGPIGPTACTNMAVGACCAAGVCH